MKIKFGDLTVSQMKEICDKYKRCNDGCPLFIDMGSDRWQQSVRARTRGLITPKQKLTFRTMR